VKPQQKYWDVMMARTRSKTPHFVAAVATDAKMLATVRGERNRFRGRFDAMCQAIRLMWVSDAFFAQTLYRAQARLDALGVPFFPRLMHRLAISSGQVCIGRAVVMHPGVCIAHGQVVIDGFAEIHRGVVILPSVTIGLRHGDPRAPTIEQYVRIGTGAKVLGHITVRRKAQIGANAVVLEDVPAGATVVGVPARIVGSKSSE
jgi:serine O-acetyltransferase